MCIRDSPPTKSAPMIKGIQLDNDVNLVLKLGLESELGIKAQIHRYCLKIYPKMCHKFILKQSL